MTEHPVRVLVVDDQAVYRDAAQFVIEMSDGFELAGTAETAEEGLGLTDALHPDLVLMDINLPGINGLEATRRIVADHPETWVIVFSTHSVGDYEPRARAAGAIGCLAKADLAPDALAQLWADARG
ncbi:MAG: response regulator [Acidimicrobiales bacterium]